MKILVIVRQTPDTEAKITSNSAGNGIESNELKWILNPFDEFAVEEAVKLKENNGAEVVILGVGPDRTIEAIRTALAMGGDSAIHIKDESFGEMDSYALAKVISSKIKEIGDVDLILSGKKWIDEESGQVAVQIAEELNIPQATIASKVDVDEGAKTIKVQSEIEGGQRIVELSFPALVTCERGLNEPRYASLPGIMKAKKKPLEEVAIDAINLEELGLTKEGLGSAGSRYKVDNIEIPVINRSLNILKGSGSDVVEGGEVQKAAEDLAKLLREEAKII
ncbi:electron transfer flavoprotein subunit beta/FixA family protein [bacterium]|jgi:electron transfer flavoprotein beta subunit|nr:electron transfer flavoprotein subunit beta/FixA family protein [bacterium]MBT4435746.1 electron transfer flavoprotein subunit beta/FixA family protein [bacterium]|tara:strand:- start:16793 stop:17629 length:837 start_codon:yes stop_codon:yes gene_type:complete